MAINVERKWMTDVLSTIQGAWPELSAIHRRSSMNRQNWENLVNGASLTSPWAVIELGSQYPDDWGRDNFVFRQMLTIYYVASTHTSGAATSGQFDIQQYTLEKAHTLRLAFMTTTLTGFQLGAEYPTLQAQDNSLANQVFYQLQAPFYTASIQLMLMFGESNVDGAIAV